MSTFLSMLELQLMLFIIMLLGGIASRKGIINAAARKSLSDLLISIILPCNIIASFQIELSPKILYSSGAILLIGFLAQFFYLLCSKLFYRKIAHSQSIILQYATICSNAGFLGLPIIGSLFGAEGTLYASIALIPLRIFMWSAGLSLFTVTDRRSVFHNLLRHPCITAVWIGFLVMLFPLPDFLGKTLTTVGNCTTTVSMFIIGSLLSEIRPSELWKPSILWYSFIRLLLIPLSLLILLHMLPFSDLVRNVTVVLAAMPAASTSAILASKYDQDAAYASQIIFFSTCASLLTLPVIYFLISFCDNFF